MKHAPGFLAVVDDAKTRTDELTVAACVARVAAGAPLVLVDVREDREWDAGRVAGAVHLGRGVLERDVEAAYPDLDTPLVLYCGGGFRSALAADMLQRMGYRRVWSLAGGWKAWVAAGLPTER